LLDALKARVGRRSGYGAGKVDAEDLNAEMVKLRKRLRRTRWALRESQKEVGQLRAEITAARVSLRDPFPDAVLSERILQTIAGVCEESLTYLRKENLAALASVVAEVERSSRPGLIVEAGTARGGSAIVLAAAKSPERPMKVYDVFGMIPEPTSADGPDVHHRYNLIKGGAAQGVGGETYYGYRDDLVHEVTESFARHFLPLSENNVELVRGLFQDTIDIEEPVALAHLDGDWYESTKVCLERLAPLLVPGGRLVLDDYYAWSGCRAAVDEYFSGRGGYRFERRARLHVVRMGPIG